MLINMVFDYYVDIINVPDSIGVNIKKYQNQCDRWLFNKLNEHEFWEKDNSGKKLGVGVCSESFIYWLNKFVLKDSKEKAYILQKSINMMKVCLRSTIDEQSVWTALCIIT